MSNENELSVFINTIKFVPYKAPAETQYALCKDCRNNQYDEILDLIQSYIDTGKDLLKDFEKSELKISHIEAEGFLRAAISIFEHVIEYKESSN